MNKVFILIHEYDERYIKRNRNLYVFSTKNKAELKREELVENQDIWDSSNHIYEISEQSIK